MNERTLLKAGYKKYTSTWFGKTCDCYYQKKIKEDFYVNILFYDFSKYPNYLNETRYCASVQFNTHHGDTFDVELLDCKKMSIERVEKFFEKLLKMKV